MHLSTTFLLTLPLLTSTSAQSLASLIPGFGPSTINSTVARCNSSQLLEVNACIAERGSDLLRKCELTSIFSQPDAAEIANKVQEKSACLCPNYQNNYEA
ncbi:hypothetical protein HDV05_001910, partial [Chytridiales sp. JEL 0842]